MNVLNSVYRPFVGEMEVYGPQVKNPWENLKILFKITTKFNFIQTFMARNQISQAQPANPRKFSSNHNQ